MSSLAGLVESGHHRQQGLTFFEEEEEPFSSSQLLDEDVEDDDERLRNPWSAFKRTFGLHTGGEHEELSAEARESDELELRADALGVRQATRQSTNREKAVRTLWTPPLSSGQSSLWRRQTSEEQEDLQGVLEKRSPWWAHGWRPRRYLLSARKFLIFRPDQPDRPLSVINLDYCKYELHCSRPQAESGQGHSNNDAANVGASRRFRRCDCEAFEQPAPEDWVTFFLKPTAYPDSALAFRGPEGETSKLIARIATVILQAQPNLPTPMPAITQQNFWMYPNMAENHFLDMAESGDLLLFRGMDRPARLQRTFTRSLYDHVALILRRANGEILLLEATGKDGVDTVSWNQFKSNSWHEAYASMVFRKVYFARNEMQIDALHAFVKSVLGQPYGLSVGKLLKRSLSASFDELGEPTTGEVVLEEHRSFFCSELTAACLKRCGVLRGNRSSSSYWPGSFSQHSLDYLPMQEHAYVGEEMAIVFDT